MTNYQITDARIYWKENELIGNADKVELGELENKTIEHDTLGSIGTLALPTRGVSTVTFSMEITAPDPALLRGLRPNRGVMLQAHSWLDAFDEEGFSEEKSARLITVFRAFVSKRSLLAAKKNDRDMLKLEGSCNYLRQQMSNENSIIVEIDLSNRIYRDADGDIWPL